MSEHDSDLPDPRELFERMEREARESEREGSDGEELPDPEELFREMERYRNQLSNDEESSDSDALSELAPAGGDDELPDPEELFEQMRRMAGREDENEPRDSEGSWEEYQEESAPFIPLPGEVGPEEQPSSESWGAFEEDGTLPFIPLPDEHVGGRDAEESSWSDYGEEALTPFIPLPGEVEVGEPNQPMDDWGVLEEQETPFIPLPDEVERPAEQSPAIDSGATWGLPAPPQDKEIPVRPDSDADFPSMWDEKEDGFEAFPVDELESWGEDDSLPYIPSPDEAPLVQEPPPEDTISSTGGFLSRLKSKFKKQKLAEEPPLDFLDSAFEPDEPEVPARLPTPEELFRQMKAEKEEAALNFDSEVVTSGESMLPTPEELFQRMEEEYAEQEGAELPALPDLEALKAEIEAEERARLDPDVDTDLAGPERFVETVSDNIFARDPFDFDDDEVEEPAAEKFLPRPTAPPVPPPPVKPAAERPATPRPVKPAVEEPASPRPAEPAARTPAPPPKPVVRTTPEPAPELDPEEASPTGTVQVGLGSSPNPDYNRAPTAGQRTRPMSYAKAQAEERAKAEAKKKFKRFSRQKLSIFTRQMSVMLKAGIQLHMAVQFAADSDPELHEILTEVMRKVESGYTFSAALGDTSRTFDHIYVGLVQSGEMSGRLHDILARLADALEREVELRKRIIAIVTYPLVLLLVCFAGTLGFIFFVLPTLTPLFKELSVDLPLPTKILLSSREWLLPGTLIVALLVFLFYVMRDRIADYIHSKPMLERRLSMIPFHIPVFGQVYDKLVTARVLYSLSTMLDVGITLNQALARTEATAGNALVAFRLSKARLDLADGMGVTDCFRFNQLFTPSALYLISAGEESARLAEMFAFVARIFDEDVEYSLQSAANILEPLIMVVMGMVVGFITIAAALPTIHLLQNFT